MKFNLFTVSLVCAAAFTLGEDGLLNTNDPPVTTTSTTTTTLQVTTDTVPPVVTTKKPNPPTEEPVVTTDKPTPTPTTAKPLPTTEKPVPTTQAPVPSTVKPAPTTEKPAPTTEKPAPTTTEKPKPTTTPEPAPTTEAPPAPTTQGPAPTVKPTPSPVAAVANYSTECVRMTMIVGLNVSYTVKKTGTAGWIAVNAPSDAVVTGTCGDNTTTQQTLGISWGDIPTIKGKKGYNLDFTFDKAGGKVVVTTVALTYHTDVISGAVPATVKDVLANATLFSTTLGNSYLCVSVQDLSLQPHNSQVLLSKAQIQAFGAGMNQNATQFGTAQECMADSNTSNIVPIAVGAALAALVVIVLIAYLISRSRNSGGYESV